MKLYESERSKKKNGKITSNFRRDGEVSISVDSIEYGRIVKFTIKSGSSERIFYLLSGQRRLINESFHCSGNADEVYFNSVPAVKEVLNVIINNAGVPAGIDSVRQGLAYVLDILSNGGNNILNCWSFVDDSVDKNEYVIIS